MIQHHPQRAEAARHRHGGNKQAAPDTALEVLLAVCIDEPQHDDLIGRSSLPEYGLSYWPEGDPPIYFRGPFLQFLRHAPHQGLSFVIKLTNFGTRRCTQDGAGLDVTIGGHAKRWLGDSCVFRWHHDWPLPHGSQIQSTLMALERWMYEQIDRDANVEPWVARLLAESESLAFACLLFDVGKRAPALFATVFKPFFFTWEVWNWDFQIATLRQTHREMIGYWGNQAPQLIAVARDWYRLPHRLELLLRPDGAVARTMLGYEEFRPFFDEVRARWTTQLDSQGKPEHPRLLIERINPDNYTFQQDGNELVPTDFRWTEALARENEESLRKITEQQAVTGLPWRCRKLLDAGRAIPQEQLQPFWQWLQTITTSPPELATESGEPLLQIEDVIVGSVAVLLVLHHDWLLEDSKRMAWCREKLHAIATSAATIAIRFRTDDRQSSLGRLCGRVRRTNARCRSE